MLSEPLLLDRYAIYEQIAAGGMATVHYGRLQAPGGFLRTVAIKRIHQHMASDPEFVDMFLAEARLVARIQHPNVVQTLDIVQTDRELFVVLDYVHGESLATLLRESRKAHASPPLPVVAALMIHLLQGLHAAHEAKNDRGEPLRIVHRDVSPHNVLVGVDGMARVADFGVAKARGHTQNTREGQLKGKLNYMAPEQLKAETVDARADLFSCGVIFWEALANRRLFSGESDIDLMYQVLEGQIPPLQKFAPALPQAVIEIIQRALARQREGRFASAAAMAAVIERSTRVASPREVGEWVKALIPGQLEARGRTIEEIERHSSTLPFAPVSLRSPPSSAGRGPGSGPTPSPGPGPAPAPAPNRPTVRTVPLPAVQQPNPGRPTQGNTVPLPVASFPGGSSAPPVAPVYQPGGSSAPPPVAPAYQPPAPPTPPYQPATPTLAPYTPSALPPYQPAAPTLPPYQSAASPPYQPASQPSQPQQPASQALQASSSALPAQPHRAAPQPQPADARAASGAADEAPGNSPTTRPSPQHDTPTPGVASGGDLRPTPSIPRAPPVQVRSSAGRWGWAALLALVLAGATGAYLLTQTTDMHRGR